MVSYVSINETQQSDNVYIALVIFIISKVIYEIGQLAELNWNFREYFDGWNLFDSIASSLLIIWMLLGSVFELNIPNNRRIIGQYVLSFSAIPLCLGLLQSLSINKKIGELLIMIKAMSYDILTFLVVYVVCSVGFSICFNALFYRSKNAMGYSMLSLFSATLGEF